MTSSDDGYRAAVYTNALIMKEVVQYLDKQTLARLSQAGRQGWQYALQPLWRILPFISVGQIERFGTAAGNTIMIKTRGYATYGDLVHTVGLSLLSGRWEKVKPEHLKIIVENCKRLKDLDINLCLAIGPEWIAQIFQASPTTSASLTSLNLTEVAVNDIWLIDILKATPNLKSLEIGETDITNRSLQYIGESMKTLEYIEMRDCLEIDDNGVAALISGCTSLKYIGANNCPYVENHAAINEVNDRGEWEDIEEYVSDDLTEDFDEDDIEEVIEEFDNGLF